MLSLIICTYNRDKYIYNVLKSIAGNDYPHTDYEIVLVNNNSTDNTESECKRFQRDFPDIRFNYCVETNQGLRMPEIAVFGNQKAIFWFTLMTMRSSTRSICKHTQLSLKRIRTSPQQAVPSFRNTKRKNPLGCRIIRGNSSPANSTLETRSASFRRTPSPEVATPPTANPFSIKSASLT